VVVDPHRVRVALEQQPVLALRLGDDQFGLAQRSHVRGDAADRVDTPLRVAHRKLDREHQAIAIVVMQHLLDRQRLAGVEHLAIVAHVLGRVLRRQEVLPRSADEIPRPSAEHLWRGAR
jgi:hypothetical protein